MSVPRQVLVLNSTYEPVNVCSTRRAIILLLKGRAEMVEAGGGVLRSERTSVPVPLIIRLSNYVRLPRAESRRLSRRAVLARDGYRCQYCGSTQHLTVDHIVPRSRGGTTCWENVITSCAPCNVRKGACLPSEVGMSVSRRPRPPLPGDYVLASQRVVPDAWLPYLEFATA
ncbi:MAG: HNH endonuclease [Thermoleophilia bacterium]|nr:HNH endonuclease [Thermoleophilia bacterium]